MTNKRIKELVDFMFSSTSSNDVPFRISLSFGMSGIDLNKQETIELLKFLRDGEISKKSFDNFISNKGLEYG